MRVIILASLLTLWIVQLSNSAVVLSAVDEETRVITEKIRVLDELLLSECPNFVRPKRAILPSEDQSHLGVLNIVFKRLFERLVKCRHTNAQKSITTKKRPTRKVPPRRTTPRKPIKRQTTTTPKPPTTMWKTHPACLTATLLDEPWRLDHNGSDLRPGGMESFDGYACDFNNGTQWFKFSGDGGDKILDSCPLPLSCGTLYPYWTDHKMPGTVGVPTTINVYGSSPSSCKGIVRDMEVIRCSWNTSSDLIYKVTVPFTSNMTCFEAFCGMEYGH